MTRSGRTDIGMMPAREESPIGWIDDNLCHDAHAWPRHRRQPTMLIDVDIDIDPRTALTDTASEFALALVEGSGE